MTPPRTELIDLHHAGIPHAIGTWRIDDILVDCGPTTSLPSLVTGLGDIVPRVLLLTHIHLDHAGGAGELVKRFPDLIVYVHEVGAPHMADPARLVKSATRLYGDDMDRLWGPVTAVPEENIKVLRGGESLEGFRVEYTPGHASHHVAFLHEASGRAFVGDAAGVRILPEELIMPHAPPPDIDLEAWSRSLDAIEAWGAESIGLPHFGVVDDVNQHLEWMRDRLQQKAELARSTDQGGFVQRAHDELETVAPELQPVYLHDSPPEQMYLGLRRYWDKLWHPVG